MVYNVVCHVKLVQIIVLFCSSVCSSKLWNDCIMNDHTKLPVIEIHISGDLSRSTSLFRLNIELNNV